ncbi:hypothetical protein [Streptomyces sp. SCL15-6]|uniref:hypothetical protein n=1 Tax=Streptomyces sp. SCL15-6 TaxID=2967222 RepID=UPI0029660813|nr:hypothetical protein [Streptomyces sp. SCL15-6]
MRSLKESVARKSAITVAVLAVSLTACSDDERQEPNLTAAQVCASTLDKAAAAALERMGDTKSFRENYRGTPEGFSLASAARTLHHDATQRTGCFVYRADDDSGHPLIDVDFAATAVHAKPNSPSEIGDSGSHFYPIGLYAKTHNTNSATLYFACSTRDGETKTPYVKATLYSAPDQVSAKAASQDLMTILNTMSRALAGHLGCTSEAALPSQVA